MPLESASDSLELPPDPGSVGAARDFVRDALSARRFDEWQALVVTSELTTNVVRHAGTRFKVTVELRDDEVRIEVENGAGAQQVASDLADDQGGRGLEIIEKLATGWGVESRGNGKAVWVTLPLSSRHSE